MMMMMMYFSVVVAAVMSAVGCRAFQVGYAWRSILPTINGRRDYVDYVDPSNINNAYNPGTYVGSDAFDDGEIELGNAGVITWVLDDVKTSHFCIRCDTCQETLIIVNTDLYMLFSPDLVDYKEAVRRVVGNDTFNTLRFITTATHSHSGPDTSGLNGINFDWYASMLDQLTDATLECLDRMEPANVRVADINHRFSQGDYRDPHIFDPKLNVMQATRPSDGSVIATLVQYHQHVELGIILFFFCLSSPICLAHARTHIHTLSLSLSLLFLFFHPSFCLFVDHT
jgi:hypothetical protein